MPNDSINEFMAYGFCKYRNNADEHSRSEIKKFYKGPLKGT